MFVVMEYYCDFSRFLLYFLLLPFHPPQKKQRQSKSKTKYNEQRAQSSLVDTDSQYEDGYHTPHGNHGNQP